MLLHQKLCVCVAAWTASVMLTVLASTKSQLAGAALLWAGLSMAVAITSSVSLMVARAQHELLEDLRDVMVASGSADVRRFR